MAGGKTRTPEAIPRTVAAQIRGIEHDAQAALKVFHKNIGGMKDYPPKLVTDYRNDQKRLWRAHGDFNHAWNLAVAGKPDGKRLSTSFAKYATALTILERHNALYGAYVEAKFAFFVLGLLATVKSCIAQVHRELRTLKADLLKLRALLEQAKKEVRDVKLQMAANVLITAVTLCLGPLGWAWRAGGAAASIGLRHAIDAACGPSKGSALGTINTVANDVAAIPDYTAMMSKTLVGSASVVSAVGTLKMDSDELDHAKKILRYVQSQYVAVTARVANLDALVRGHAGKVKKAHAQYAKALAAAQRASARFRDESAARKRLLKDLAALG